MSNGIGIMLLNSSGGSTLQWGLVQSVLCLTSFVQEVVVCHTVPLQWDAAHQFIFSFLLHFSFVPCGRLSWLSVSFLLHVKYTLSYRTVSDRMPHTLELTRPTVTIVADEEKHIKLVLFCSCGWAYRQTGEL